MRYWRLSITDVFGSKYPPEKANHWEVKCMQGEYQHFGVFWYRYGTPFDKEPVYCICLYYNDIPQETVHQLASFLQSKFYGNPVYRQNRVFLFGSKEFADPQSIAKLAEELSSKFNAPVEITIEFEKVTKQEQEKNMFNFPSAKALPIDGAD